MNFPDWLDAAPGRLTSVAAHERVTLGAVSQWRTEGVPMARMRSVRDFTGGEVSLDEMLAHRESKRASQAQAAA